jgi:lysozyme
VDLTAKTCLELVGHEAIVLEAYKDSENIWTWGVGVTTASGHSVEPYIDHPQTVEKCLEVYIWLLRTKYVPAVLEAFGSYMLSEAEFAAALSFHYNTGAILRTDWVTYVRAGHMAAARTFLETHYTNGGALADRRKKEAALFFDSKWSQDGKATIYPVLKPSYHPDFRHPQRADISADVAKALEAQ